MSVNELGEHQGAELSSAATISRGIVQIHAQYYGRGPTKAKTLWRDEVVVCVLQEVFTKAEKTLIAAGKFGQVRENRQAFQDAVAPLLCQAVEEAIGQPVGSFLSQVSPEGVASEVFLLEPAYAEKTPGPEASADGFVGHTGLRFRSRE